MFSLLTCPASSLVVQSLLLPSSLLPPTPDLTTAVSGPALRAAVSCAGKETPLVPVPVRRPGTWKQLQAWLRRKTCRRKGCMISAPVKGGVAQRVRSAVLGSRKVVVAESENRIHVLSPVADRKVRFSEDADEPALDPSLQLVTALPAAPTPLPAPQPEPRQRRKVRAPPRHNGIVGYLPPAFELCKLGRNEVRTPPVKTSPRILDTTPFAAPEKAESKPVLGAAGLKSCLRTGLIAKPKRSIRFAPTELVQEYTPWNSDEKDGPWVPQVLPPSYERGFKRVHWVTHKGVTIHLVSKYLEPEGHLQLNFPSAKWIFNGPAEDAVDDDGDIDMCDD